MRIIGGEWRRRLLKFPDAPGLRPTPDRVRETLFNWLGQDLTGKACLDLFAGSGVLGFEAASRHAAHVVMVESNPTVLHALQESREILAAHNVELVRGDALDFLRGDAAQYDVVFLDPPYASAYGLQALALLSPRLYEGALVYLESGAEPSLPAGWTVWRYTQAGKVHSQLLQYAP
ncbi:MAG: 16S rRNA (guanine(966)-N(2))-methyltransferase RsmD [Pseudomonadota bacterium]